MSDDVKLNEAIRRYAAMDYVRGDPDNQANDWSQYGRDMQAICDAFTDTSPVTEESLRAMGFVDSLHGALKHPDHCFMELEPYCEDVESDPIEWIDTTDGATIETLGQLRCLLRGLGITTPGEQP
jgi:hypothetical protein